MTSAARLAVNALTASEQLSSSGGLSAADSIVTSSGTVTHSSGAGSSGKSFKCQFCAKEFPKSCNLTTHLRTHTGEKPYLCGVCQRGFSQSGSLHVHQRTHTGEKPYKCHLCDKRFVQVGSLSVHLKIHTGEQPHQCHLCQQRFAQSSSLRRHIKIHNGEKNYKCKFCAKDFVQSSQLVKHTRTHTGEKPYACKYCDKRFSQSNSLEIHQRVHTGERPYKCDFCDKRFPQSSLLTRHIQVHTRENFCKCDFCDKPFPLQSLLDEHMQLHRDNPFECEYCNKCFSKAARLMEHLKEHAGEEPYRCRFCDKTFTRHRNLCQHLKFHTRQRALVFPQVEKFWEELQDPNGVKITASHAAVCDVLTQSCFKDDNDLFKTIAAGALREKIHPGDTDTTGMELTTADLAACCKNEQHMDACDAAATSAAVAAADAANRRNGYPPRLEMDVSHKKAAGLTAEIHCCDDQDNNVCDNATDENQAAAAVIDQGYKPLQVDLQMSEQVIGHGEKTCKMLCTTDADQTPTVVHTYISSCHEQGHITAELPPGAKAIDHTAVVTAGGPYQCGETIIATNAVFDGSVLPKTSGACLVSLRTCEPSVFTSATAVATAPPPTVHLERAMSAELAVVDQLVSHSQTPVRQKDGSAMDIGKPNLFECDMDIKLYLPDRGESAGSALSVTTAHPVHFQHHPHHVASSVPQQTVLVPITHHPHHAPPPLPSPASVVHIPATMRDTKRKGIGLCTFTCKGNMYTKPNVNTLPSDCVEKGRSPGSYDCDLPHGYG